MTDTTKKSPDWEVIERHFRAGLLSLREIATNDGNVTEGAIRKRAKRDGWSRDLKAKIQQKAEELVRKEQLVQVRMVGTQLTPSTERQEVESSAQVVANIRLSHQADIGRSRGLFRLLLEEVEGATLGKDGFDDAVTALREAVTKVSDADDVTATSMRNAISTVREQVGRLVSVGARIDNAKRLVEMLERLVRMEREAFGITSGDEGKSSELDDLLIRLGSGS